MGNESDRINVLVSCQEVLNAKVHQWCTNHECQNYGRQASNRVATVTWMEGTTALKTKIGEQEKTHENRIRVLSDEATKVLETIRVTNARQIEELAAEHER